jgi:competence protein ComEA
MKRLLLGDRAESVIPAHPSRAARLAAWAKESLTARILAVAAGLVLLAAIGGSALARNTPETAHEAVTVPAGPTAAASAPPPAPLVAPPDAGPAVVSTEIVPVAHAPPEAPSSNTARATPDDPVDLNAATEGDLRRLPGIGAKRAEAILALRARLPGARFHQLEDLLKVKGVGRAMLKRLHPVVRISP